MDVGAAAEMPRPAFEAQLTGWVKELLAETKIQLNFTEQRELVELLIDDMLGLGPLEPLLADETVTDIMVNGPKQVYVERRGKLELTDVTFRDNAHVMNIAPRSSRGSAAASTNRGRWSTRACPTAAASTSSSRRWRSTAPRSRSANSPRRSITLDIMAARQQHLAGDGDGAEDRGALPAQHPDLRRHRLGQDDAAQRAVAA